MIENQLQPMALPEWVVSAITDAPWELCYSQGNEHLCFADLGMPVAQGRSTLPPIFIAKMLAAIEPNSQDYVLELGSSVMRVTSIIAKICCGVLLLESDEDRYKADCEIAENLEIRNLKCSFGIDFSALAEQKFSIIILNHAVREVPGLLFDLLQDNGRICALVGNELSQEMHLYTRNNSRIKKTVVFESRLELSKTFSNDEFQL